MVVYLTDAWGREEFRGITDDGDRARAIAEEYLSSGRVTSARIERARPVLDLPGLTESYQRTGTGWTAVHHDGEVMWTELAAGAA